MKKKIMCKAFPKEKIFGEEGETELRLRKLYGQGDYKARAKKHRKNLKEMYVILIVVFVFAAVWNIYGMLSSEAGVNKSSGGKIVSVSRPSAGEGTLYINANVTASKNGKTISDKKRLAIAPEGAGNSAASKNGAGGMRDETAAETMKRKVDSAVRAVNSDSKSEKLILPDKLDDGTKLSWEERKENELPMILFGAVLSMFLIYRTRSAGLEKEEAAARSSIIRELPGFINKLVLLLNAGVVLNKAFRRIMTDYERLRGDEEKYFYEQLRSVCMTMDETNSPMHVEFAAFAKRSEVRELMRLSNILSDNVNKGYDLAEKLRRESEVLWFARKKQSEENGRIAETKLTLPLMILLLVMIMITIAPAMMEM